MIRFGAALLVALVAAPAVAMVPAPEKPVEAPGPQGPLRGTMIAGSGKGAPVLIIPGSGPTDRDGNSPLGVKASSYRLLAEALADRGITSVRVDKRGMFGSAGAVVDGNAVTVADYAADIRQWVGAIRKETGSACVWLLGHSEGGLVALAAAAQDSAGICGLVLVAAPGRKVGDALRDQLRANPANAPLLDQALPAIARLEAGERVDPAGLHPALLPLFAPQVQGYLISLFAQSPAALLAKVREPVLVVQGSRDLQVGEADARALANARPGIALKLLPGVNHVLKAVASDDRAANIASYADPALPLAPEVADAIASFVLAPAKP